MIVYKAEDFRLLLDGLVVECLTGITLSEDTSVKQRFVGAVEWKVLVGDLQGWSVSVSGYGVSGYEQIRDYFRNKNYLQLRLESYDGQIIQVGLAIVTEIERQYDTVEDDKWRAILLGVLAVEEITEPTFLLLEDGDYVLLEDGDKILN